MMAALIGTGLGLAALFAAMAFLMAWMLSNGPDHIPTALMGLAGTVVGIGILRVTERVLAEKLGQHYVQQLRRGLVKRSLAAGSRTSVGITIARTTNDLSSVRNWIVLGMAPVTVAVPTVLGTGAALWLLSPALAMAAIAPVLLLALVLALLSGPALSRAREVRRRRGRLAAHIADTLAAAASIQAAGGTHREVSRIGLLGDRMVEAAMRQATIAGWLRSSAAVAAAASVVAVAGTGALLNIDTATIAAGLTAASMMSVPVTDTGRIVEYRQKYLAARHILAPLLATPHAGTAPPTDPPAAGRPGTETVQILDLSLRGGAVLPALNAERGQRMVIRSADPDAPAELCRTLLGLYPGTSATILIDGQDVLKLPPAQRRNLIGYAASGANLERGTIARAVRYRRPDLPASVTAPCLAGVGLLERVQALPAGEQTTLRAGGEPLTRSERARLQLARASLGNPPLLVLEHIDRDLGAEGCLMARGLLKSYPGVVIIASENPAALASDFTVWDITPM